jgi:succinate-acetate transporter protein
LNGFLGATTAGEGRLGRDVASRTGGDVMNDRVANPKALGFGAFAILAWMYSIFTAGWYGGVSTGSTMTAFLTLAVAALFISALASFLRNETWHAVFFMFWTAAVWAVLHTGASVTTAYGGWYAIMIAVISLFLLLAALRIAAGLPVVLLNLGNTLVFVGFALTGWTAMSFWTVIAGYIGLATGLAGLWAAWNEFAAMGRGGSAAPAA